MTDTFSLPRPRYRPSRVHGDTAAPCCALTLSHVIQRERKRPKNPTNGSAMVTTTYAEILLSFSRSAALASDANPAKRIAAEKEEQGSERSFRRKAEAESSGLCDDAIPRLVA